MADGVDDEKRRETDGADRKRRETDGADDEKGGWRRRRRRGEGRRRGREDLDDEQRTWTMSRGLGRCGRVDFDAEMVEVRGREANAVQVPRRRLVVSRRVSVGLR